MSGPPPEPAPRALDAPAVVELYGDSDTRLMLLSESEGSADSGARGQRRREDDSDEDEDSERRRKRESKKERKREKKKKKKEKPKPYARGAPRRENRYSPATAVKRPEKPSADPDSTPKIYPSISRETSEKEPPPYDSQRAYPPYIQEGEESFDYRTEMQEDGPTFCPVSPATAPPHEEVTPVVAAEAVHQHIASVGADVIAACTSMIQAINNMATRVSVLESLVSNMAGCSSTSSIPAPTKAVFSSAQPPRYGAQALASQSRVHTIPGNQPNPVPMQTGSGSVLRPSPVIQSHKPGFGKRPPPPPKGFRV